MNARLIALATLLTSALTAQTVSATIEPNCRATAGLRSGGTADVIRVTNQSANDSAALQVHYRVINAVGAGQGQPVEVLLPANASVSKTVGQIFLEAGLRPFNANYLIQVVQHDATVTPVVHLGLQFQATYRNSTNGQVLPLLFTCTTPDT